MFIKKVSCGKCGAAWEPKNVPVSDIELESFEGSHSVHGVVSVVTYDNAEHKSPSRNPPMTLAAARSRGYSPMHHEEQGALEGCHENLIGK